jgi:hypothetical protein
LPSHFDKHLLENVVLGEIVKTFLTICLLTFSFALAQDTYVGGGLTAANIPAFVMVGYNDTNFGTLA